MNPKRVRKMSNTSISDKVAPSDLFGVFPIDSNGAVGEHIGGLHHTLAEAEQHLVRARGQYDKNYIVLSSAEYDIRINEQRSAGLVFKTGHDLLMDEFD